MSEPSSSGARKDDNPDFSMADLGYIPGLPFSDEDAELDLSLWKDWYGRFMILLMVVVPALLGILSFLLIRFLVRSFLTIDWDRFYALMSSGTGRIVSSIGVVGLGAGFYILRCKRRRWYGMLEIAVASVGGWVAVGTFGDQSRLHQPSGTLTAWFGIFASIYVVVRGLDNLFEGLNSKKKLAAESKLRRKVATLESVVSNTCIKLKASDSTAPADPPGPS